MEMKIEDLYRYLDNCSDPIIRWNMSRHLPGHTSSIHDLQNARIDLASSPIIQRLLSDRNADGQIPFHPYDKWYGSHWVLSILADLGYPEGDNSLKPLMAQCYEWLLSKDHQRYIRMINGRFRHCASQEGNCIYYSLALGLADDRTEELVARLMKWQWEDGGWNCDKRLEAAICSFNETLIPLRGMAWYAKTTGDQHAKLTVNRAAEVFLKRQLFRRLRDGQIIDHNFIKLHYPNYWHYDVLFALKVMGEAGFIADPRCNEGLDLLESKMVSDGGFPAEEKYYRVDGKKLSGYSRVDWGGTSKIHSNPFVSVDAFSVLLQSGRLVM
ncbi:MAG: hypothetical protein A2029_00950 [Chloroflexi bacterium RBG_19FT_COMBO_47_9]|nr:MAG: hypothetical protein A2Y53_02990 [Chloroflexi bacterium RBG_16_47_49]OGO64242.1 MAG: hypothetical protein A2029_00950 [Chloroflexi bacterium RBG_19FT_COMBO_47_9]